MATEAEWITLIEVAENYIDSLRQGEMTWRDYYNEVRSEVFEQQSNTR